MAYHTVTVSIPPLSLRVSLGLSLVIDSGQGLVWVVPVIVAPRWTSMVHVTHHTILHHAMAHHTVTVSIPPLSLGVSLGLSLIIDSGQGLVWVVPVIVAPRWTSMVHVTHHAILHHAMAHHTVTV